MKVLYSKFNSERDKRFQLKTIIFEENGTKYVKKEALNTEALEHLKSMKSNYKKISDTIINPNIKLAPIVDESPNSLTFAFIEGESLEQKFNASLNTDKKMAYEVIESYIELLKNGFKTRIFDHNSMITKEMKVLFGEQDYAPIDKISICFVDNFYHLIKSIRRKLIIII